MKRKRMLVEFGIGLLRQDTITEREFREEEIQRSLYYHSLQWRGDFWSRILLAPCCPLKSGILGGRPCEHSLVDENFVRGCSFTSIVLLHMPCSLLTQRLLVIPKYLPKAPHCFPCHRGLNIVPSDAVSRAMNPVPLATPDPSASIDHSRHMLFLGPPSPNYSCAGLDILCSPPQECTVGGPGVQSSGSPGPAL